MACDHSSARRIQRRPTLNASKSLRIISKHLTSLPSSYSLEKEKASAARDLKIGMAGSKMAWLRKKTMAGRGSEERRHGVDRKFAALASPLRRWRQYLQSLPHKPFILRKLFDRFVFSLIYAAEAVAIIISLCFFYLRFGFRL